MKLSLYSHQETVYITLDEVQYKRLRNPEIQQEEILLIARECSIKSDLLTEYVKDLKKTAQELIELDASCDYSDHL